MPSMKGLLKRACAIGRRRGLAESTPKTYQADLNPRLDRPDGLKTPMAALAGLPKQSSCTLRDLRSVIPRRHWLARTNLIFSFGVTSLRLGATDKTLG
jgi:hypothetical protein